MGWGHLGLVALEGPFSAEPKPIVGTKLVKDYFAAIFEIYSRPYRAKKVQPSVLLRSLPSCLISLLDFGVSFPAEQSRSFRISPSNVLCGGKEVQARFFFRKNLPEEKELWHNLLRRKGILA